MGDRGEDRQRCFKVTPKGRAPEVTMEWPAGEKPWYIRYAYDWMLFLLAVPFVTARAIVDDDGWASFVMEIILVGIFFMWLVSLTPENYE